MGHTVLPPFHVGYFLIKPSTQMNSADSDDELDSVLDTALNSFDIKQQEEKAKRAQAASHSPSPTLPGEEEEMLHLVQQLTTQLLQNPDQEPALSAAQEKRLEAYVAREMRNTPELSSVLPTDTPLEHISEEQLLASLEQLQKMCDEMGEPKIAKDKISSKKPEEGSIKTLEGLHEAEMVSGTEDSLSPLPDVSPSISEATGSATKSQYERFEKKLLEKTISLDNFAIPFLRLQKACERWEETHAGSASENEVICVNHHRTVLTQLCELLSGSASSVSSPCAGSEVDEARVASALGAHSPEIFTVLERLYDKGEPPSSLLDLLQEIEKEGQ